MNQGRITKATGVFILIAVLGACAQAQSEAGSCAGLQGTVEVQHGGTWQSASVGAGVFVGDHVRTAARSRATMVFRDDSVLDIAPNTEFSLEAQEFDESTRHYRSFLRLAVGKLRVWASAYYSAPRARYEVETPTAVATVHGTEFIIAYDAATESSDVIGLDGQVDVTAKLAVMGAGVEVGPHTSTRIFKGKFPSAPQRAEDARLAQFIEGVDLVGTGRRDGLNVLHPAVVGRLLAPQDVPSGTAAPVAGHQHQGGAALSQGAPAGPLADSLSADVYTNTQPLLDYRQTTGGVHIGF